MKRILSGALLLALALGFVGCGGETTEPAPAPTPAPDSAPAEPAPGGAPAETP